MAVTKYVTYSNTVESNLIHGFKEIPSTKRQGHFKTILQTYPARPSTTTNTSAAATRLHAAECNHHSNEPYDGPACCRTTEWSLGGPPTHQCPPKSNPPCHSST
jgi:hypothetical protein